MVSLLGSMGFVSVGFSASSSSSVSASSPELLTKQLPVACKKPCPPPLLLLLLRPLLLPLLHCHLLVQL